MPSSNLASATLKEVAALVSQEAQNQALDLKEPVPVLREGSKILIPEGMPYKEAHAWLDRQEQAEMKKVAIHSKIECFPLDGIIALSRAFREVYGYTDIKDFRETMFGTKDVPPTMIEIPTPTGMESAPFGQIMPPKWDGGWLKAEFDKGGIVVTGELRRMFEKEAQSIITLTKEMLLKRSIYRGQAVQMDLGWYDGSRGFDPIADSPKFMEIGKAHLILNKATKFELATSLFMLIENTAACKANKIPLKHGALLKGTYGTGKTMTAKGIARKCVDNGWTFIYLARADQLASGLRVAKMYAPAVVFAEDIDTVVGERNEDMNDLLNTLDGVDTKDAAIITVLTTNHPERIEPSFLRAGRIDSVIDFGAPEADTAIEFVRVYSGPNLRHNEDLTEVGIAFAGMVPAFICEAVSKAKRFAINRTGLVNIDGHVTSEDLILAANSVKSHVAMLTAKPPTEDEKLLTHLKAVREFYATPGIEKLGPIYERFDIATDM